MPIVAAGWCLLLDVLGTFITPALAFATWSAFQATKIGVRTLVKLWPGDWAYALVPPLAISAIAHVSPNEFGARSATVIVGMVSQFLASLFAGPTTLRYLREADTSSSTQY
jgi:hypothetical protein